MRKIHNIFMSMIFAISVLNSFGMQDCNTFDSDGDGDVQMQDEGRTLGKSRYCGPFNEYNKRFSFELCCTIFQNKNYLIYRIIDLYDNNKEVNKGFFEGKACHGDFSFAVQELSSLCKDDNEIQISFFNGEMLNCVQFDHLKIVSDVTWEGMDMILFTVSKNIKFINEMLVCIFYSVFPVKKVKMPPIYRRTSLSRKCKKSVECSQ